MSDPKQLAQDARALAQERLMDALLRALALEQPHLLDRIRSVLVDTEYTHTGKPGQDESVHQQINGRIAAAARFAAEHGGLGEAGRTRTEPRSGDGE